MSSRIVPVLLILIAFGIYFGYVNPTYTGEVAKLKAEINGYDGALAAADRFLAREGEILTERQSIPDAGFARVEAFLPDGVDNVQLILDLNALASRSGLSLSNFDIAVNERNENARSDQFSLVDEGPVASLDLSVSATGTYSSFKSFLRGVEWSLRPLDLVQLSIDDSQSGIYTYSMTFRIYWLR